MAFISRFAGAVTVLLAILTLVACTASSRVIRAYDGDAVDPSRVATLLKPDGIEIEQIDGKDVKSYIMDSIAMTYELLPGQHSVTFRYSALWAVPGKKEIGEKNAEEIRSEPQQVTFTAVAGKSYTFEVPSPSSREEAVRIAQNFSTRLIDENSRAVATSSKAIAAVQQQQSPATTSTSDAGLQPPSPQQPPVGSAAVASAPVAPAAATLPATSDTGVSNLEALKVLWESASAEDKKEFLRWAFK